MSEPYDVNASLKALMEAVGLDESASYTILEAYVRQSKEILDIMEASVTQYRYDFENLKEQFHKLKGSSGNVRIIRIYDLAQNGEKRCRLRDLKGVAEVVKAIRKELTLLEAALSKGV